MYGERIRERRESLGLSQLDLAVMIASTPTDIMLWEEEQTSPTVQELIDLSDSLGVTIDWLVGSIDYDELGDIDVEDIEEDDNLPEEEFYEDFLQDNIIPHMNYYMANNEDPSYIHVQFSENGHEGDCVIYSGRTTSVLSSVNMIIKSISEEIGVNYYDLVALMATINAKADLGEEHSDDK